MSAIPIQEFSVRYTAGAFLFFVKLSLLAQVDTLQRVRVNEIFFEGNRKTKERYLQREFSFKRGHTYRKHELDSIFKWDRNRIYNTNLFNEVDFEILPLNDSTVDIKLKVDERWYLYPLPVFRLIDRNFNVWWNTFNRNLKRVTYGMDITQYNFRGRGERVKLSFRTGFIHRYNFSYDIPYIDKKQRQGLLLATTYFESKNPFYKTENNRRLNLSSENILQQFYRSLILWSYRSSFLKYHHVTLTHQNSQVNDTITLLNPNYFEEGRTTQKLFSLSYSFLHHRTDRRNYPLEGEHYTASILKYGLGIYNEVDIWLLRLRASKFYDLGKDWYYQGTATTNISFPNIQAYANYFAIGFQTNLLRGYDLYVSESPQYVIQKNEIKKKLLSIKQDISKFSPIRQFQYIPFTVFSKFFFDHGYAVGYPKYEGSRLLADKYLYSAGVGLDVLFIYDTVFELYISRNILNETNFFLNFRRSL